LLSLCQFEIDPVVHDVQRRANTKQGDDLVSFVGSAPNFKSSGFLVSECFETIGARCSATVFGIFRQVILTDMAAGIHLTSVPASLAGVAL
jgi:hypothetical protein